MYKVKIFSVGRTKEAWLDDALKEYAKRLSSEMAIEWLFLKTDGDLQKALKKESSFICLDPEGRSLSSPEFAEFLLAELVKGGSKVIFAIGGPEGIPAALLAEADHTISISKLTFTHQIVRLILIEQLYRSIQIHKGTGYHKGPSGNNCPFRQRESSRD